MKAAALLIAATVGLSVSAQAYTELREGPQGFETEANHAVRAPGPGEVWIEFPDDHTEAALEQQALQIEQDEVYGELAAQYMEAARWYQERNEIDQMVANLLAAADHNSADAFFELARLHVEGVYLPLNFESAAHYLQSASALGHAEAQRVYGRMLMRGDMGQPEPEKGLALLLEASESSPRALGELGMFYAGTLDGVTRDLELGVSLLYQAAAMGDPEAKRVMENVSGVPESLTREKPKVPTRYSIVGYTGKQVYAEANAILVRAQGNKSRDDEALAYALYSLAYEYLGHEPSGKEIGYLEAVNTYMSRDDPDWLERWREKARGHLKSLPR